MKPYYEQDNITIYHGDCREVLPTLAPQSVDLIVTDPPYGERWESSYRQNSFGPIAGDHSQEAAVEGLRLALPVLRLFRHAYIFGRYDFGCLPVGESAELIWDKGMFNGGDLEVPWGNSHEYIQFVVNLGTDQRKEIRGRLTARMRRGSVLRCLRPNAMAVMRHPTEKPVDILREMIESSSLIGECVLDPFAGSGSTLEAARLEGRSAVGIEIKEEYCETIANRLAQGVLFSAPPRKQPELITAGMFSAENP